MSSKKPEAYKDHMAGSRKGLIHRLYDEPGPDVAWTRGLREGLKENTLRFWFAFWHRTAKPATKPKKPAPKKKPAAKTKPVNETSMAVATA